jgi:hypothetical protein
MLRKSASERGTAKIHRDRAAAASEKRRHFTNGMLCPVVYERAHVHAPVQAPAHPEAA